MSPFLVGGRNKKSLGYMLKTNKWHIGKTRRRHDKEKSNGLDRRR